MFHKTFETDTSYISFIIICGILICFLGQFSESTG